MQILRFLLFLSMIGLSASRQNRRKGMNVKQPKYDMACDCGQRPSNLVSEKDCQVSAAMEQLDQGKYCYCQF